MRQDQHSRAGCPAHQGWALLFLLCPTALLLHRVVQGAEMVGNDPTLAWLLAPSGWKEDRFLKPWPAFFCGSKASPILASSPG